MRVKVVSETVEKALHAPVVSGNDLVCSAQVASNEAGLVLHVGSAG